MAQTSQDRNPSPDLAEDNAFFPSPYSLSQYTASKTDFDGTDYPTLNRTGFVGDFLFKLGHLT